jgi:hypothetical protein
MADEKEHLGAINATHKRGEMARMKEETMKQYDKDRQASRSRGRKPKVLDKGEVIRALEAQGGRLTYAAKELNIHFRTLKRYINENDDVKEALIAIEEAMLDAAEATLREAIEEGNLKATIFYLKTKGKRRGYAEHDKQDINKLMQPVAIVYHSPRDPARLQQTEPDGDDRD